MTHADLTTGTAFIASVDWTVHIAVRTLDERTLNQARHAAALAIEKKTGVYPQGTVTWTAEPFTIAGESTIRLAFTEER